VNSERLNFVRKDDDLDLLIERAGAMRGNREFSTGETRMTD